MKDLIRFQKLAKEMQKLIQEIEMDALPMPLEPEEKAEMKVAAHKIGKLADSAAEMIANHHEEEC